MLERLDVVVRPEYRVKHEGTGTWRSYYRVWWWPFWLQCDSSGIGWGYCSSFSEEDAVRKCQEHWVRRNRRKRRSVRHLGRFNRDG